MSTDKSTNECIDETAGENYYHSTRLVCAKMYEGGLFCSWNLYQAVNKRLPFKGKSPEFELNIYLVRKHSKAALTYHLVLTIIPILLSVLGLLSILYLHNAILSSMFSVPAIFILLLKPLYDKHIAFKNFSRKCFKPYYHLSKAAKKENEEKSDDIGQNTIIFGNYYPFLGAGHRIRNRNFLIDLAQKQNGQAEKSTDSTPQIKNSSNSETNKSNNSSSSNGLSPEDILFLQELFIGITQEIKEKNLPNISFNYFLFANGKEAKNDKLFFSTNLESLLNSYDFYTLFYESSNNIFKEYRGYINIRYHDRIRSTLLSTFLRFTAIGNQIFAEYSFYFLPPIDENRFNIDRLPRTSNLAKLKKGFLTLFFAAAYVLLAPSIIPPLVLLFITLRPAVKLFHYINKDPEDKETPEEKKSEGEPHNYGLVQTFRESIAVPNCDNYFNAQDIIMIQGIIEKSILNSVANILDSKELDSSFLRRNMLPQVDQNIMTFDGKIKIEKPSPDDGIQISSQKIMKFLRKIYGYFLLKGLRRKFI